MNGMLMILGLNADSEVWQWDDHQLTAVVDGLINELLKQRAAARERKDFATADAIRSSLLPWGSRFPIPPGTPLVPRRLVSTGGCPGDHRR